MEATVDQQQFKNMAKNVVSEVLQEQRGLITEAVHEAMEDLGLARAIEEGRKTATVSREQVFQLLSETE